MAKIKQWLDQFEACSLRERLLLLAGSLGTVILIGYLIGISPQLAKRERWIEKINQSEQEHARIIQQNAKLEALLQQNQTLEEQQRLSKLKAISVELDHQLVEAQAGMISPELVPEVLQDLLQDLPLILINLRKLPPEIEVDSEAVGVPKIYRHALRLELQGSYNDTLDYIERLEQLPWGLAWETLDIHMQRYPKARIILHLYTLSLKEEWLGV